MLHKLVREGKGRLGAVTRELRETRGYATGFETLFQQLDSHLPTREEVKNGFRKAHRTYPESAVRELLTNMLVHQDFAIAGMGPMIEIFSDRVEFTNPGRTLVEPLRLIGHPPRKFFLLTSVFFATRIGWFGFLSILRRSLL